MAGRPSVAQTVEWAGSLVSGSIPYEVQGSQGHSSSTVLQPKKKAVHVFLYFNAG